MADHDGTLTRELASLARIELTDSQTQTLAAQLDTILDYIRRLHAVDVTGVPEYEMEPPPSSGLRDDEPRVVAGFEPARALAGAPMLREHQIAVPKYKD
jgi:aspartyl-tRNA(Asn)/glutamyl-tRNA(Gln) amidotransferase subunit C